MEISKIIGMILGIIVIFPSMILVYMAILNIKDEKKTTVKSQINFLEIFYFVFTEILLVLFSVFIFHNIVGYFGLLVVIIITILAGIDGVIAFTHFIYNFRRTVYWDKKTNQLFVENSTYNFTIDLQSSNSSIFLYDPPVKGGGRGVPGFAFSYLKIFDDKNKVKISSTENIFFDLNKLLEKQENYTIKKQQFNFLF